MFIIAQKTKDKNAKVKKTKKGTVEKQSEDEDKCVSNLRRSSRSCSRAATEAITECVEVSVLNISIAFYIFDIE